MKISPRTRPSFEKPTNILARSRQSRRDFGNLGEMEDISLRFKILQTSWRDLYKSRRDLGNLIEMEEISQRSRRDLESRKHHGEISTRSRQSRRDLGNNFARALFCRGSIEDDEVKMGARKCTLYNGKGKRAVLPTRFHYSKLELLLVSMLSFRTQ